MIKMVSFMLLILFFAGCSGKELIREKNQESALIVIKTPKMRYADMGFIYKDDSFVKVEIYSMGQALVSLEINAMNVCMSTFECMTKSDFNEKMLNSSYPDTLLENIFRGKPIFGEKNIKRESNSFTQKIKKEGEYEITYSVVSDKRVFRDKINKIVIKVEKR